MNILENLSKEELTNLVKLFDIQIGIVLIIIVLITKSLVAKIIINIYYKVAKREGDPKESGLYGPLKRMYVFLGIYLAVKIWPITGTFIVIMESLLKVMLVIFVTQIINNTIFVEDSFIFKKSSKNKPFNKTVGPFAFKILRFVVWCIAIYIMFLILGFDLSGLITGLGIGTVIISLAAQDTVKSLLSGWTILSDKPFTIGDYIVVGTYSGTVIKITFRSTRIRCKDNSIVTIPNSTITSDYVTNWSRLKSRRIDYVLNIEMDVPTEKIKKIVKELKTVLMAKDYVKEDSVYVGFNEIASFSNDIKIFLYITETNYSKYLDIKQELNIEILNVLEKENVGLAYPTETVQVKNIDDKKESTITETIKQ